MKLLACLLLCGSLVSAQTYAERLGWKAGDRVVIIHVDDAGMSHDSDRGVEEALEKGIASSFSVMMPCPWVPEIVNYIKRHPQVDAGIHVTLTSEWDAYRWGPVAGIFEVPGLVDGEGAMWRSVEAAATHATPAEVEKEIRAQLLRARNMGFNPTHLDSHMGTVFATPAFLERYIKVGAENHIPVMFPGGHDTLLAEQLRAEEHTANPPELAQAAPTGRKIWDLGLPVLDDLHNVSYGWTLPAGEEPTDDNLRRFKTAKYKEAFHKLRPGLTMIIMHCTDTSATFPYISTSGNTRHGDLLAMEDPEIAPRSTKRRIDRHNLAGVGERRKNAAQ